MTVFGVKGFQRRWKQFSRFLRVNGEFSFTFLSGWTEYLGYSIRVYKLNNSRRIHFSKQNSHCHWVRLLL